VYQWSLCADIRGRVRPKKQSRLRLGRVLGGELPLTLTIEASLEEEGRKSEDCDSCYSSDHPTGDGCW
jgi:hypothetical protein